MMSSSMARAVSMQLRRHSYSCPRSAAAFTRQKAEFIAMAVPELVACIYAFFVRWLINITKCLKRACGFASPTPDQHASTEHLLQDRLVVNDDSSLTAAYELPGTAPLIVEVPERKLKSSSQLLLVMRHGHRQDEEDPEWDTTAARPWDPPLSALGRRQVGAQNGATHPTRRLNAWYWGW
jgi:hypothetical protein